MSNDRAVLDTAHRLAGQFLETVASRHVGGRATRRTLLDRLGGPLPAGPGDPVAAIEQLAQAIDPGLVASVGPRYFGFVTGGAVPVTVAADWLVSAWDQNVGFYVNAPGIAVIEEVVAGWILDLLYLP